MLLMDYSDHPHCLRLLGLLILVLALLSWILLLLTILLMRVCWELQHSVLEEEGFSLALDVEDDLGSVGIHNGSSSVQEWSSQNDGGPFVTACIHYHEVCRNIRVAYSYTYVFKYS